MHSLPQSRPLADPAPSEREPWGVVYHVLTRFANRAPSQDFGGSKPPPYGVRFICLSVGTPLPGRPENVAIGTVLPGEAYGMIRGFPRRADDICPYGAGITFSPGRGGYQPPANVAGWHGIAGKGERDDTGGTNEY